MSPSLSIVIPTYRRADILARCLQHIERQTVANQIEVVVVSDGHDDETTALFAKRTWKIPIRFFEIKKSQQGVARNRGVREAQGKYILFIGDDIFLAPDACEIHLLTHAKLETQDAKLHTVLGFTTWDPDIGINEAMRWMEASGDQFGFSFLKPHAFVDRKKQHKFTYTSNISLPRDTALEHPFLENHFLYGYEDIEWGLRLKSADVSLFYEPAARALHHHHYELDDCLRRAKTLGRSSVLIEKIAPDINTVPKDARLLKLHILALFPTIAGRRAKAFLQGISETKK